MKNCDSHAAVGSSTVTGEAAEKFRADIQEMFSSQEHANTLGIELDKLNGWFSGMPISRSPSIYVLTKNGEVDGVSFAKMPAFADYPYRVGFFKDGSGQGQFLAKCNEEREDNWQPF